MISDNYYSYAYTKFLVASRVESSDQDKFSSTK